MRTKFRLGLAAVAVGALTVATAAPAGAQEEPEALGFAVDKTQAQPGALVLGKADPADVAEHCTTDLETFRSEEGPFVAGIVELVILVFGEQQVMDPTNFEELAADLMALITLGVIFDEEIAADVLAQTFVMTFADIATQEPVGERSNFDPNTGEGSVVVPDIDPGLWAVAAACVSPSTDPDVLAAGVAEAAEFLEGVDLSGFGFSEPFPTLSELVSAALNDEEFQALLEEIGPSLFEPIMVPDAFGAVLFCILDEEGNCPADEEPAPPPGEPVDVAPEGPAPAQPVVAAPTFTG